MANYEVIRVIEKELFALQQIGKRTFEETYAFENTPENLKSYLKEKFAINRLRKELNTPDSIFYFVCEGDKILGYMKLNFGKAQTESHDLQAVEIERIYILKSCQSRGLGQILFDKAVQVAKERQASSLWLGVWTKNQRAIKFYKRNGMQKFGRHLFTLGGEDQEDYMMRLQFTTGVSSGECCP